MLRFIVSSYSFKWMVITSCIFIAITWLSSWIFDAAWGSNSTVPVRNLDDVYKPPPQYDNFYRVNLKLVSKDQVAIEGNEKFKLKDSRKDYDFYDTLKFNYPDSSYDKVNKIYFQFINTNSIDSIYLVISVSQTPKIFYNQIFYSSVIVYKLNQFSKNPANFRIKHEELVSSALLADNDTLINKVFKYFNDNIDALALAECGTNCQILRTLCSNFGVPCRIAGLQGGDANEPGYNSFLGYPMHNVCEIYSSKLRKWYVVDPTYGFRFIHNTSNDYLNAVEISNNYTFVRENEIRQDSILFTKRSLVGRDYFKYYENVFFKVQLDNKFLRKVLKLFYPRFIYYIYCYANNYPPVNNGFYYFGLKTFMYFFILILYINSVLFVLTKRLFSVKKPK